MLLASVQGRIELKRGSFMYPSRPNVPIFQVFSLAIPAGSTVAIVGGSGSGKSTVISLIKRFCDLSAGEVYLDGVNIKKLELKWLRDQIRLVNQEPALFAIVESIKENILYGKPDGTDEEVADACRAGGQKQRIAIARASLKNSKILLSTIRNAHAIAVVQNGNVVEMGNHDTLMVHGNGAYVALVCLQEMGRFNERSDAARSMSIHDKSDKFLLLRSIRRVSQQQSFATFDGGGFISRESNLVIHHMQAARRWRLLKINKPKWGYGAAGVLGSL